jgi:hypothetical protein
VNEQLSLPDSPKYHGEYSGTGATKTEEESGKAIFERDNPYKPLRPGSLGHQQLSVYADGKRRTAYDASYEWGQRWGRSERDQDWHRTRRETERLFKRGFLIKDGTLPNHAPGGRKHVDAFRIVWAGWQELERLRKETD